MPRNDFPDYGEIERALDEQIAKARGESAPDKADIEKFFADHPESHQCFRGFNPWTGTFTEAFERQEITIDDLYQGPPYFKDGFLEWLRVEMKYNPEWKEHHG